VKQFISIVISLVLAGCASSIDSQRGDVAVRLIGFNDFHGALKTPNVGIVNGPAGSGQLVRAGGAAYLASAIKTIRGDHANVRVVGAGDLINASPLISSLFLDEPAIEVLSKLGLNYTSVGNHEFDRGYDELVRLQRGGCHTAKGCFTPQGFKGAGFKYLTANVRKADGASAFTPYVIDQFDGVPFAFVGAVLKATPTIVPKKAIEGLTFIDEADAANSYVPALKAAGVKTAALLIHEGGNTKGGFNDKSCPQFEGAILRVIERLDPMYRIIVSGHTHQAYICRVGQGQVERLVTSASSNGRLLTQIDFVLKRDGTVDQLNADNIIVSPERFAADREVETFVESFAARSGPLENRVVGRVAAEVVIPGNRAGESPMGNLIADAQLAASQVNGAQIAFTNTGGLRAPLISRRDDGGITFGEINSAQPFGNVVTTMTLTGAQIIELLEGQFPAVMRSDTDRVRILQVSSTLNYSYDLSRAAGQRVLRDTLKVSGEVLQPNKAYRVTTSDFLYNGGDGITLFKQGTDAVGGPLDVEALESFLAKNSPYSPPKPGRITRLDNLSTTLR
jgi:5'-nucleotidase